MRTIHWNILAFVLFLGTVPTSNAQLERVQLESFKKHYAAGDLEKAAKSLELYENLSSRRLAGLAPKESDDLGLESVISKELSALVPSNSVEGTLKALKFATLYYTSGDYQPRVFPGEKFLQEIGEGVNHGRKRMEPPARRLDYLSKLVSSLSEEEGKLLCYTLVWYLGRDYFLSYTWRVGDAWSWYHDQDEEAQKSFFCQCLKASIYTAFHRKRSVVDPICLSEYSWDKFDKILFPLFSPEAGSPRLRVTGASLVVIAFGQIVNMPNTIGALREAYQDPSLGELGTLGAFDKLLATAVNFYALNEEGTTAAGELLASGVQKYKENPNPHIVHYLVLNEVILALSQFGETYQEEVKYLKSLYTGDFHTRNPLSITAHIAAEDFDGARALLPAEGDWFRDYERLRFVTRPLGEKIEEFRKTLPSDELRMRFDAMVFLSLARAAKPQAPSWTMEDRANYLFDRLDVFESMHPNDQASIVAAWGRFEKLTPRLEELIDRVDAVAIPDLQEEHSDDVDNSESWHGYHATRMKAMLVAEDWEGLEKTYQQLADLEERHRDIAVDIRKHFTWRIVGTWPMAVASGDEKYKNPEYLDFFYRALAFEFKNPMGHYQSDTILHGHAYLACLLLGETYSHDRVREHLPSQGGKKRYLEFTKYDGFSRPLYEMKSIMVVSCRDWGLEETREDFQTRFYDGFFGNEFWVGNYSDRDHSLRLFTYHVGLTPSRMKKIHQTEGLNPFARYLLAKWGAVYEEGDAGKAKQLQDYRQASDELFARKDKKLTMQMASLYAAYHLKKQGEDAEAEKYLERVGERVRKKQRRMIRQIEGE